MYTLTSATSRHPIAHWMFSNHELSFIANLRGRARAFFFGDSVKGSGFVVIHTKVEMIEFTIPRKVLTFSIHPAEMSKGFGTAEH